MGNIFTVFYHFFPKGFWDCKVHPPTSSYSFGIVFSRRDGGGPKFLQGKPRMLFQHADKLLPHHACCSKDSDVNSTLYIFRRDFHNLLTYNRLYCHAMACVSRLHGSTNDCRSKFCKTRIRKMYKIEVKFFHHSFKREEKT